MKCTLCQNKEADQTGSHIFPLFLIKSAINEPGAKGRNKEISFELSNSSFANLYFGSEILPSEIRRIKGRNLTDDEIEAQINPYIRDNIFCIECEKRIATLESFVNIQIIEKLRKLSFTEINEIQVLKISQNLSLRVFVYSLAWRAAITNFGEFGMLIKHQEELRSILDDVLDIDKEKLNNNLLAHSKRITSLPLRIGYLETIGLNTNSIFCSHDIRPYSWIINDFAFQIFFKDQSTKFIPENFFGLTGILKRKHLQNLYESEIHVAFINDEKRKEIKKKLYEFIAKETMKSATNAFQKHFFYKTGRIAPPGYVALFKHEAIFNSDQILEKYTPEHFKEVTLRIIDYYYQNSLQ